MEKLQRVPSGACRGVGSLQTGVGSLGPRFSRAFGGRHRFSWCFSGRPATGVWPAVRHSGPPGRPGRSSAGCCEAEGGGGGIHVAEGGPRLERGTRPLSQARPPLRERRQVGDLQSSLRERHPHWSLCFLEKEEPRVLKRQAQGVQGTAPRAFLLFPPSLRFSDSHSPSSATAFPPTRRA